MKNPHPRLLLITTLLFGIALLPIAAQTLPDPHSHAQSRMNNPNLTRTTGEQFAWHANSGAGDFVNAYLASEDTRWLNAAITYFDYVIGLGISDDPDGYPGTIGALIGQTLDDPNVTRLYDSIVRDSLIAYHITRFAEVVHKDESLHDEFLEKADEYIDLAIRMVWEKWDHRDTFYVDSRGYGSYHTHPYAIDRDDRTQWIPHPARKISDNLNKHYKAGIVFLRLYRITGDTNYRDRVLSIFGRAKAMFRYFPEGDRVVWNFWMPHGPWDMSGSSPSSWVGVHSNRPGYQSTEVSNFLEVYNTGLVFDQTDIERMIRTNLWMWDNDFVSADGTSSAGQLWGGLSQVSPEIRDRHEQNLINSNNSIGLAYLRNVVDPNAGFGRIYVSDPSEIIVDDVPVQPGVNLRMALPIPDRVETINDDEIRLVAQTARTGPISIDLLDSDGNFIGELHSGNAGSNYYTILWDGTNPATGTRDWGEYLIRWTLQGESRTWPVFVVEGEEREDDLSGFDIRPGQTLSYNFESALDDRWELAGATISSDNAQSGSSSLRLGRNQRATLNFGSTRDLPVRIEFWQYDTGVMWDHATQDNANGPAWGVNTAMGDTFAFYMVWRSYIDGSTTLGWINTGENQWFSPRGTNFGRNPGWNHWEYDYSDPEAPVIYRNGVTYGSGAPESSGFFPNGAVGVTFIGTRSGLTGDAEADSVFYIDNVTVTHTGDPISVFEDSHFSENVGGGWKFNQLGFFYDSFFPYVYSTGLQDWLYLWGFSEQSYFIWSYSHEYWAYTGTDYYPYIYILTGANAGQWMEVTP